MPPTTSPRIRSRGARIRLAAAAISAAALLAACGGREANAPAGPGGSIGTAPSGPADPAATLRFSFGTDAGKNYDPAAIDRAGISRSILGGQCIVSPQIFPRGYWAAAPNLSANASTFDVTAAKRKLADAGFPNGFAMSMTVVNGAPYSTVAEAIASQFEQIGVKVVLQIAEPAQVIAAFTGQKSADSYVGLWPGAVDLARTVASLYLPTGTFNPGAAQDPEIVRLAGEGLAAPDDTTRAGVYQRLSARAVDQHVHLPICSAPSVIMASAKVRGLSSTISGTPDLRAVEITRG